MKKQKNAFTLVELIVVITILAILGTIAFINLQGYSMGARDSKRVSDISNIQKKIGIEMGKGTPLSTLINTVKTNLGLTIDNNTATSIQGTANFQNLKEDGNSFKDPTTKGDYVLSYSVGGSGTGAYKFTQIGTINEENNQAIVKGNYYQMNPNDSPSIIKNDSNGFVQDGSTQLPYELIVGGLNNSNTLTLYDRMFAYLKDNNVEIVTNDFANYIKEFGGKLYFIANNNFYSIDNDGNLTFISGRVEGKIIENNNKMYFSADTVDYGNELHIVDLDGNIQIIDTNVGPDGSYPQNFTFFNGNLYYSAYTSTYGSEIYYIDSSNNIFPIEILEGNSRSYTSNLTIFNNKIYFIGSTFGEGSELYSIDSGNNVTMINNIPGSVGSLEDIFLVYNNKLYFKGYNRGIGTELYYIDASNNLGSFDINTGGDSYPENPLLFNDKLYFLAYNNTIGQELFYVDSSNNLGNVDISSFVEWSYGYSGIIIYNNKLFYSYNDGINGTELYEVDLSNNYSLYDINPGSGSSEVGNFNIYNNKLYFTTFDPSIGNEILDLNSSDILNVNNINTGANIYGIWVMDNKLYYYDNNFNTSFFYMGLDGNIVEIDGLNIYNPMS